MSTGPDGMENMGVFPVSPHGQRIGRRAPVPSAAGAANRLREFENRFAGFSEARGIARRDMPRNRHGIPRDFQKIEIVLLPAQPVRQACSRLDLQHAASAFQPRERRGPPGMKVSREHDLRAAARKRVDRRVRSDRARLRLAGQMFQGMMKHDDPRAFLWAPRRTRRRRASWRGLPRGPAATRKDPPSSRRPPSCRRRDARGRDHPRSSAGIATRAVSISAPNCEARRRGFPARRGRVRSACR